ncbi:MAG: thiamine-phosphate kinase [Deltaproteobacteria bacterium]
MSAKITSEDELIRMYLAPLTRSFEGAFHLADDCAIYTPVPGRELVITTDAVAAGVHFFADDAPEDIAWKALTVNVSDLASKAAAPRVYQMALSFPEAPSHEFMQRFANGLAEAQAAFGIVLSGGDTDRRPGPLSITVTAIGEVEMGVRLTRDGARAGDAIFVTGTLGDAACGLKLRRGDEDARAWAIAADERAHLVSRYLRPRPRLEAAQLLRRFASASLDLSDGLAKDLGRLAAAASAGAIVDRERLPLSPAVQSVLTTDPALIQAVLGGGDDYELLFTARPDAETAIVDHAREAGLRVTRIGTMRAERGLTLASATGEKPLQPSGWDHF